MAEFRVRHPDNEATRMGTRGIRHSALQHRMQNRLSLFEDAL
jgi:hypothetical protein